MRPGNEALFGLVLFVASLAAPTVASSSLKAGGWFVLARAPSTEEIFLSIRIK
jgi:hypothetical protein